MHNLVIALAKVRIVALNLQDEEKVGVGGILWQSLTDSIQIVCPGVDNAFQVGLDEVLEGHAFSVVHFSVDVRVKPVAFSTSSKVRSPMLRVSSSEKVCAKSFSLLFSLIANNVGFHKYTHFFSLLAYCSVCY